MCITDLEKYIYIPRCVNRFLSFRFRCHIIVVSLMPYKIIIDSRRIIVYTRNAFRLLSFISAARIIKFKRANQVRSWRALRVGNSDRFCQKHLLLGLKILCVSKNYKFCIYNKEWIHKKIHPTTVYILLNQALNTCDFADMF